MSSFSVRKVGIFFSHLKKRYFVWDVCLQFNDTMLIWRPSTIEELEIVREQAKRLTAWRSRTIDNSAQLFTVSIAISRFGVAAACASKCRVLRRNKITVKENTGLSQNGLKYAYQSIQILSYAVIFNLVIIKT